VIATEHGARPRRGRLRIYLGAAPGVGKTYAMLAEGWRRKNRGTDIVIGYVETHGRASTAEQIRDLEIVPRHKLVYRGQALEEMDVDGVLTRHPTVALIDELAHTNVPGSRHEKRWQDIEELLDAGIDVISTVNIQHLASLNDAVERITGVPQRETVPDSIVRAADQIELVDMTPEALRRRMAHGNIYRVDKVDAALAHYFRVGNLCALRELALLWVANRVDEELAAYRERHGITDSWETKERVVVALTGAPGGEDLLRRASRMAARLNGELIGVHVRATDGVAHPSTAGLDAQRRLLGELGGRFAEVTGLDVARSLVHFARAENATQLLLGASGQSRRAELLHGSVINRVIREAGGAIDIHVISPLNVGGVRPLPASPQRRRLTAVPVRRQQVGWLIGTIGIVALGATLLPLRSSLGVPGALLCLLLGVIVVATVGGVLPAAAAAVVATTTADFFFVRPYYSLRIARASDIVAMFVFFAVAAIVASLIDRLARRGIQVARAQAEAEALARLAGGSVVSAAEAFPDLVTELRRTFDLDGVAVLVPDDGGWRPIAAAGGPVVDRPQDAPFSAELDERAVLVLSGSALSADDTRLLAAFVAQLRQAQERARLEAEAASAADLAEANSLREALLAAVSHDLRTPLAGIKAAATSLLSQDVQWSPDQASGFAKTINAESDRLTNLVDNLLDMSRLNAGALRVALRPTRVDDVLYRAVDSLGSVGSGVVVDVAEVLPQVAADPGLLERALANVMDNAIAWSPPGTAVRVEAVAAGDLVDVRVIDQGPGIPVEQREVVFQPFQRLGDGAGASPNGVGLGLAVARGFVEAIGGEVSIEDTPGGGTTVVFRLMQADPAGRMP
jgi:two-component system, OmpR family, sensor histidine kinase KdpD